MGRKSHKINTMNKKIGTTELEKLIEKWLKRRSRLGKRASDLRKTKTEANLSHSDRFFGRFCEIEKCRSELVAIINRMNKDL